MMQKHKSRAKGFALFLGMMLMASGLLAQQRNISGTVKDVSGEPIIGASVLVKGTNSGVITNIDGEYNLSVPGSATTLTVRYVGKTPKDVAITGNVIHVVLEDDQKVLDEVVVIGYGTARRRDLTGSVTSIQGKTIAQIPVTGTAQAMAGRMAGVQVTSTDGSPDAEILVRVRGGGSITGDNSPLYIVDGFPASNINDISPSDIQSIDVLKDASSTAIYGSQGANGVVIVTTKQAQGGKTKVSYNGFVQTKRLSKRLEVLDPFEYALLNYEYGALGGEDGIKSYEKTFGVFEDIDLYKYMRAHDWQQDMFGSDVVSQQQNISLTGGTDKTKFSLSSTFNKDGGLMTGNDYTRFTTNFKLDHELYKNLKATFNLRLGDTKVNGSGSSGGLYKIRTTQAVTSPAVKGLSEMIVVDPALMTEDEYEQWQRSNMSLTEQAQQYWKRRNDRTFNFIGGLDWKIIKSLVYRIEGGYEYGFGEVKNYWGENTTNASYVDGKPLVDWTKTNSNKLRLANTLTYMQTFAGDHSINVLAGQELISNTANNTYIYATGYSPDLTPEKIFANLALGGASKDIRSTVSIPNNLLSFFGRAVYNYKERYLLSATFRADGSSRFAPGNQWGYFPSVAAAWRIVEEPFMKNTKDWISNLKLRYSYGEAGNNKIGGGQFQKMYSIQSTKTYGLGDIQNNYWATSNTQLPNKDLRWETSVTQNIGLDFGFFDEKLSGTFELYQNTNKDLLLEIPIVAPGYRTTFRNIGQTTNKGIELSLNSVFAQRKNFSLYGNFNIGFNKSNVDKLADGITLQEYASGWAGTDLKGYYDYQVKVGEPVGLIYGWVNDGYYKTTDFTFDPASNKYTLIQGVPSIGMLGGRIGTRPGTAKFKDLSGPNGQPDGVVNDFDRTVIGRTAPKFLGGFGLNGTVYDFDFTMLFNFVYGNQVYNANKIASAQQYRTTNPNMLAFMRQNNRYTYLNNETGEIVYDLETLAQMNEGANAKEYWSPFSFGNAVAVPMSWAIEDGSFLRFQNLTVGYTVPKMLSNRIGMDQLRVYATVNNLWILTRYTGYDPEVSTAVRGSSTSGLTPGVDYSSYPKSLSWTFGLNLTF
ncbi:MAG TPA: TonB-dependent receptor [Paludibacteraceae bacterium]|nr:TonB-dependent receptor [Paludibacteraceae bacterium]